MARGGLLRRVVLDRAKGKRASPVRAVGASAAIGFGAAALAYRALRK